MLDKSSADFDHALREIDLRSPMPLFDGVKDFDEEGVAGREGIGSNEPGLGIERSKTDLGSMFSTESQRHDETSRKKRGAVKQTPRTTNRRKPGQENANDARLTY